jgi:hypothetical protein
MKDGVQYYHPFIDTSGFEYGSIKIAIGIISSCVLSMTIAAFASAGRLNGTVIISSIILGVLCTTQLVLQFVLKPPVAEYSTSCEALNSPMPSTIANSDGYYFML